MLVQMNEAVAVSQSDMDAAAEEQMQISLQRNNETALQLRIAVRPWDPETSIAGCSTRGFHTDV
jgi:hypothetical protein